MKIRAIQQIGGAVILALLVAAVFASSASASEWEFKTHSYPAKILAEPNEAFLFGNGSEWSYCEQGGYLEAGLSSAGSPITSSSAEDWGGCYSGAVELNGCNFGFLAGQPGVSGGNSFEIVPEGCGPIVAPLGGFGCSPMEFGAQGPTKGFEAYYANQGSGESASVRADIYLSNLAYTCGGKPGTSGWLEAGWKLHAYDAEWGEQGLYVANPTRVEAEKYAAGLSGGGFETFTNVAGSFKCVETGTTGSLAAAASEVSLTPTYGSCTHTGTGLTTTVTTNGCHLTVAADDTAPPYGGRLGVTCEAGHSIEYKTFFKGSVICTSKILPQSGLPGLALSTTGSGSGRGVAVSGEAKEVKYEINGACVNGKTETRTDGVLNGSLTLTGTNSGKQVGVFVTG